VTYNAVVVEGAAFESLSHSKVRPSPPRLPACPPRPAPPRPAPSHEEIVNINI
jgi:hypothetical protein